MFNVRSSSDWEGNKKFIHMINWIDEKAIFEVSTKFSRKRKAVLCVGKRFRVWFQSSKYRHNFTENRDFQTLNRMAITQLRKSSLSNLLFILSRIPLLLNIECFMRRVNSKSRPSTSVCFLTPFTIVCIAIQHSRPSLWSFITSIQFPYTLFFVNSFHFPFSLFQLYFRYKNLNNTVATRGKVLQAAVHSLQSFDKSLDQVSKQFVLSCFHFLIFNFRKMNKRDGDEK